MVRGRGCGRRGAETGAPVALAPDCIDIQGTGVTIDVIGRGQPVEDLPPEWAPGKNDGTR